MAKEPKNLTFDEFADELLLETQPRALVILATAKIDMQLRSLVEATLLPKRGKPGASDDLLDGDNPLATFSARIKICQRAGLIDDRLAWTLDLLRGLRNQAAHWVSFGIADSPLKDQLRNLHSVVEARRSYQLTMARFFGDSSLDAAQRLQATLLTLSVLLESVRAKIAANPALKSKAPRPTN